MILGKCGACNKRKLWVSKRKMIIPQVKLPITSQNKICSSCWKGIKQKAGV